MSYKSAIKIIRCIRDREFVSVRNIIDRWPQSEYEGLLNLIYCVVKSINDEDFDEDVTFNTEISKACMISASESPSLDALWNYGINSEVPIHFDNYKAFFCACKNGNIRMIKDFRRFQYDNEDGQNMIPDSVWMEGINLALSSNNKETALWIKKYLQEDTDDEEFEESGDDESKGDAKKCKYKDGECGVDTLIKSDDDECDDDCACKEEEREIEIYNRVHTRLIHERKKRRIDDEELITRIKNL